MKLKHYYLMINLAVLFLGGLFLAYLYFIDGSFTPQLDISDLHTIRTEYRRGEMVKMSLSFCKRDNIPVTFSWRLIDDEAPPVQYNQRTVSGVRRGCYGDYTSDIEILPMYIAPGVYHFENSIRYDLNPIKSVDYIIKTNTFIVK